MSQKPTPDVYLRRQWKLHKTPQKNPNKDYIPSYKREGFDESKVIKLK